MNLSEYSRRPSGEVRIGRVVIGGGHPVAVQSMTNTDTNDTEACAAQIERIDRAGGGIVRLTAQGRREGENLANIVRKVLEDGFDTAIVADIHFVPEVAAIAAKYVDKVRINPGNYRTDHGELEALIAQCRERASHCESASITGRSRSAFSTAGAIRRRVWSSRRWSFCGSARRRGSIRSSCR